MPNPDDTDRRISANQQPAAVVVVEALENAGVADPLRVGQAVMDAVQRHYELRPR